MTDESPIKRWCIATHPTRIGMLCCSTAEHAGEHWHVDLQGELVRWADPVWVRVPDAEDVRSILATLVRIEAQLVVLLEANELTRKQLAQLVKERPAGEWYEEPEDEDHCHARYAMTGLVCSLAAGHECPHEHIEVYGQNTKWA